MVIRLNSAAIQGMDVRKVEIEVTTNAVSTPEQAGMIVVGLPDAAIRESRERVWGAILSSGFHRPVSKNIVNLAPADLRKSGTGFDLPIALGLMISNGLLMSETLEDTLVVGELALSGLVRGIHGTLAIAMAARKYGITRVIVPMENAKEAALATDIHVYGVHTLVEAAQVLRHHPDYHPVRVDIGSMYAAQGTKGDVDYSDVKGQESAKRAMVVAAAGNHNIVMIGTPGCGKSMIAKRIQSILPLLDVEEALEVTKIYSIAGLLNVDSDLIVQRPFRSPHHTVSDAGLVGGSANPRPGELSLAHHGVLFLDELPEFRRTTLEVLRQPLENGEVTIARASGTYVFPARVMLVAAMNPCPCGYYGHPTRHCQCSPQAVHAYRGRISGPLVDRVDMHIEVAPIDETTLTQRRNGADSATMKAQVMEARERQQRRYQGTGIRNNASLTGRLMDEFCELDHHGVSMLKQVITDLKLSARAYDRILRVARTLADLEGKERIEESHIWEASTYRLLDRQSY